MATVLLLTALLVPIALFWLLISRAPQRVLKAGGIAVSAGWLLNVAWAFVAKESVIIAAAFGWVCPSALVFLSWLVWRFLRRTRA